jgi:hypothetical protein
VLDVLRFIVEPFMCRHALFERSLGDGSALRHCTCPAMGQRCPVCSEADDGLCVVYGHDWIEPLLRLAAQLQRRRRDPLPLSGLLARWLASTSPCQLERWMREAVFAHAIIEGVFSLEFHRVQHGRANTAEPEAGGRSGTFTLSRLVVRLDVAQRERAPSLPMLQIIWLRRSTLDPSCESAMLAATAASSLRTGAPSGSEVIASLTDSDDAASDASGVSQDLETRFESLGVLDEGGSDLGYSGDDDSE